MGISWDHSCVQEDLQQIVKQSLPWEKLRNKKVLITGANGFLPAYLLMSLLKANDQLGLGIKITACCRNPEKTENRFGHLLQRSDLEVHLADVVDGPLPEGSFDFIIHAASQASPKYYGIDPVGTLRANTEGTRRYLELCQENTRFLYFSSSEVYGHVNAEHIPTPEHIFGTLDPAQVRACYAESKRLGETLCMAYHHQFQRDVVMVRPFHTYGPGMDLYDGRVFADFVRDALEGSTIKMKSDGLAQRAFCYLSDATAGFLTVLLKGENGQAYNIGNPQGEKSIIDLARIIAEMAPKGGIAVQEAERKTGDYLPSAIQRNAPDIQKVKLLGWEPVIDVKTGFQRTLQSFL